MNWQMVGAIGEILGAIGVIATLGYLAIQVRSNTRQMRLDAERETFAANRALHSQVSADADLARIVRTGLSGMDALNPDEAMRFGVWFLAHTYNWMLLHSSARDGVVEADIAEAIRRVRRDVVSTPGYQQWFERRKHWLPDEFRETLETEIAASSGRYVPYGVDPE